jgi:hypothetical protein
MQFIPSLELSRMLYEEEIEPVMQEKFPDLKYAAATFGMCSENLGLDDEVSMDHEWGPRVSLLLSETDQTFYGGTIMQVLRDRLPAQFMGFDMMWRKPGVDVHDTRKSILYHVTTGTVARSLGFYGGIEGLPLQDDDWLRISEQHLLEFTTGSVYRDDIGDLTQAREYLAYYPDNVLRFLLMSEWNAVGGDWFPIGRIGTRGDQLGLRLQSAKIVQRLMRIAFMVSRQYFHYKKWFGTLFKRLPIAADLEPVLQEIVSESGWQVVEERVGRAVRILLEAQNGLGIAPKTRLKATRVDDGRHHIKYDFWLIGNILKNNIQPPLKEVMENQVWWLDEKALILWNEEVGKLWPFFLRKEES